MNYQRTVKGGFSLIEILIVIALAIILATIASLSLSKSKGNAMLKSITDEIVFSLEQTKANSIAGKDGSSHGIKFNSHAYIIFVGNSYNAGSPNNVIREIDPDFEITTDDNDDEIVFMRLGGNTNEVVTITIAKIDDPTAENQIIVDSNGNINYE